MKIWMELKANTDPEHLLTLEELQAFAREQKGQDVVFTCKAHSMDADRAPDYADPCYYNASNTLFWWQVELWGKNCAEEFRLMDGKSIGFEATAWKAVVHLLGAHPAKDTSCPILWEE